MHTSPQLRKQKPAVLCLLLAVVLLRSITAHGIALSIDEHGHVDLTYLVCPVLGATNDNKSTHEHEQTDHNLSSESCDWCPPCACYLKAIHVSTSQLQLFKQKFSKPDYYLPSVNQHWRISLQPRAPPATLIA